MSDTVRFSTLSPVICPLCSQRYSAGSRFCPFDGEALVEFAWDGDTDPLLGKVIEGRYQIESVLGEGGMGKVYAVKHLRLGRAFAMKVLRGELARDRSLADRFIQEARATAAINHPSVITISDFGTMPDGAPYFVMELLEGQTVAKLIRAGGPIPAKRAVGIAVKIAAALQAAHETGVVHRDLKPENVFLAQVTGLEEVKVVDFGASRLLGASRITRTGVIFGTPHYMSPEQASGIDVDHRADIYAFGIILYEMFTGRVPFEAESFMGVITQQILAKPVPPSQVHPSARDLGVLEDITLRCLEKRPADRFESMHALRDALLAAAPGQPRARLPSAPGRRELASELELPSLAEIRGRSEEQAELPRSRAPLYALACLGAGVGVAIIYGVYASTAARRPTTPAAATAPAHPEPPVATAPAHPEPPAATGASPLAAPSSTAPPPRRVPARPRGTGTLPSARATPPATTRPAESGTDEDRWLERLRKRVP
jgi:serine/threonine-protein kinase